MRKLLAIPLMVLAVAFAPLPASAEPPIEVNFTEIYTGNPADFEFRFAGPNTFLYGPTDHDEFVGDFEGDVTQEFVLLNHPVPEFNFYKGVIEFDGAVLGYEGTLVIKAHGKQAGGTILPSEALWTGQWVIISGTGDLEGLRGQGTLSGPSGVIDFTGKVHFT